MPLNSILQPPRVDPTDDAQLHDIAFNTNTPTYPTGEHDVFDSQEAPVKKESLIEDTDETIEFDEPSVITLILLDSRKSRILEVIEESRQVKEKQVVGTTHHHHLVSREDSSLVVDTSKRKNPCDSSANNDQPKHRTTRQTLQGIGYQTIRQTLQGIGRWGYFYERADHKKDGGEDGGGDSGEDSVDDMGGSCSRLGGQILTLMMLALPNTTSCLSLVSEILDTQMWF